MPPVAMPDRTPVGINAGSNSEAEEPLESNSIRDDYPLPLAYGWSLLESFWDPRDRYREQLRQAENMLAYLGSVSLALLEEQDYERAKIDLKLSW